MKTIPTLLASVSLTALAVTAVFTSPGNAVTYVADTPALTAQSEAQQVVNRAIEAAGGIEALNSLRVGKTTFSTRNARVGQGPTPEASFTLGDNTARRVALRDAGKLAIETYNGENLGFRIVVEDTEKWVYQTGPNSVSALRGGVSDRFVDASKTSGHILLDLIDNSASIRSAGTVLENGTQLNLVNFADSLGRQQTLYFNASTGELTKMERLSAHAHWGDIATTLTFSDYKKVGNTKIAHKITTRQAGNITAETTVAELTAGGVDASVFVKPEDASVGDPIGGTGNAPRELTIENLADDIYFVPNASQGYNVILVDQADGILILETPQAPQASRDVLKLIADKFPGKKIKAAVPTHHHFDHSGGLYGYLEAGVQIITTAGNEKFVREVGAASRNIGQNSGAVNNVKVGTFEKNYKLGSGALEVQLINVGPNPHAEEIIIAYIPSIKTVFVADIFSFRGAPLPAANANQLAFADKLEELKLDIETFIPVHGSKATAEQFWNSVKEGRAAQAN